MFSTIKSIIKTLSIFSIFATLVVAGLSNVNVSAQTCANGATWNGSFCVANNTGRTGTTGTNAAAGLTPSLCGSGAVPGGTSSCPLLGTQVGGLGSSASVTTFILNIARFFIYIASAVSVIFIVWGGYNYINAADPKGNENGKKILINALIGLAICILAITIVTFVGNTLEGNLLSSVVTNS